MTAPAVRETAASLPLPALVAYEGLVFRRQPEGSARESEFLQIGGEWISDKPVPLAHDALVMSLALTGCRVAHIEPRILMGDVALLRAFVEALGLAEPWPQRVLRALMRPGGIAALRAQGAETQNEEGAGLAEAFAAMPADHAEAALKDLMAHAGITPVGARPVAEIAERLRQRGRLAAAPAPTAKQYDLLDALVRIDAKDGLDQVAKLAESKTLTKRDVAQAALEVAKQRLAFVNDALPDDYRFAAGLGRGFSYYDGFVFELEAPELGERASVGGGGRYDGLARALWPAGKKPPKSLYAAGFALRPQRLAETTP